MTARDAFNNTSDFPIPESFGVGPPHFNPGELYEILDGIIKSHGKKTTKNAYFLPIGKNFTLTKEYTARKVDPECSSSLTVISVHHNDARGEKTDEKLLTISNTSQDGKVSYSMDTPLDGPSLLNFREAIIGCLNLRKDQAAPTTRANEKLTLA